MLKDAWKQLLEAPESLRESVYEEPYAKDRLKVLERWTGLIATYSKSQVVDLDDKLRAYNSIAMAFQPILGEYIAGLWIRFLPSQLLWKHSAYCGAVKIGDEHSMLPKNKPSWSWASIDCRVKLPYYYDSSDDHDFTTKESHFMETPINLTNSSLVEVLDAHVNMLGEPSIGIVESGSIHLGGCRIYPIYHSAAFGCRLVPDAPPAFHRQPDMRWSWDYPDDPQLREDKDIVNNAHTPGELLHPDQASN